MKKEFNLAMQVLSLMVVFMSELTSSARHYKKVRIHVPVKVKHHHHTHTVFKHVHHQIPVQFDHHDVHVIHPETSSIEDYDDYHVLHGRSHESFLDDLSSDPASEYENYDKYLRKRSKRKNRLFNNKVIGWKGRKDFDKIASEYLDSIHKQPMPDGEDYNDGYAPYDDDDSKKK